MLVYLAGLYIAGLVKPWSGSVFQPLKPASIDCSFVLLRRREICRRKKRPGNKGG